MMSLWDALRMNMMISYQELVRTFLRNTIFNVPIASTCRERWFSDNFKKTLRVEELQDFICTMVIHREVI
ncbi:hypothetical protein B4U33_11155 [Klebsiella pneumoniae]|nr:hypothetical protein B4U33_11155 [Klebsiella pneumoniae]